MKAFALNLRNSDGEQVLGSKAEGLFMLAELAEKAKAMHPLKVAPFSVPPFVVVNGDYRELEEFLTMYASEKFAVRSSALAEDRADASFAGQYDSFLSVKKEDVIEYIAKVRSSYLSARSAVYKERLDGNNATGSKTLEAPVIVQVMVEASYAGVAFSSHPLYQGQPVLSMTTGLADRLVSGEIDGQTIIAARDLPPEFKSVWYRKILHAIKLISENSVMAENSGKTGAVDIEWCLDRRGRLFIVQVRPITVKPLPITVFDASNIQESYPGKTSPLTFAFAQEAYREVYKSFALFMGVPAKKVETSKIFETMLGYYQGKIYYNLASWYELVSMLPFYRTNKSFMEAMMGLKAPLAEELAPSKKVSVSEKLNSLYCLGKMLVAYLTLDAAVCKFEKRLEAAVSLDREKIKQMDLVELRNIYLALEENLLRHWQTPVVNDFYTMIFSGICTKLFERHNLLDFLPGCLKADIPVVSSEPPRLLSELALSIKNRDEFCRLVKLEHFADAIALLKQEELAWQKYKDYLRRFGDRNLSELKLETPNQEDCPAVLLGTVAALCRKPLTKVGKNTTVADQNIEKRVPFLLKALAHRTAVLIARRENLRFARTRVFGLVRLIFNCAGERLYQAKLIDKAGDVFYLKRDEIFAAAGGTNLSSLRGLIKARKEEWLTYPEKSPLRVSFVGLVQANQTIDEDRLDQNLEASDCYDKFSHYIGKAASSGIYRGRVRVIRDPHQEKLEAGEVLVAERTDPGWIMHFSLAGALVVSHGSILSHTAIVAREMKIPCVVALAGAEGLLKNGELVEVNGFAGTVKVLERIDEVCHEKSEVQV
jgi:pyruvate,water dikinase